MNKEIRDNLHDNYIIQNVPEAPMGWPEATMYIFQALTVGWVIMSIANCMGK